ncbi:hypothetical protein L1987_14109 [Smallanthus sonchifolius]|uniref:Uncharacterized protein n=1 Tax=Smallanthus sonchifolius TaxID=185202 RepID=A0ACB9J2D6_9ASTR|nr:hypothetical protein L1987_14109 [Smallanthus sonchifolius]
MLMMEQIRIQFFLGVNLRAIVIFLKNLKMALSIKLMCTRRELTCWEEFIVIVLEHPTPSQFHVVLRVLGILRSKERNDMEDSILRAKRNAIVADGISWGMDEDAAEQMYKFTLVLQLFFYNTQKKIFNA